MSGVYLCSYDNINKRYIEVSLGDFVNPILFDFNIMGTNNKLEKVNEYYIVIRDTVINSIHIRKLGSHSHIDIKFSRDKQVWSDSILINEYINAINKEIVIPIYIKVIVIDSFGVFPLNQITNYKDFKILLTYT